MALRHKTARSSPAPRSASPIPPDYSLTSPHLAVLARYHRTTAPPKCRTNAASPQLIKVTGEIRAVYKRSLSRPAHNTLPPAMFNSLSDRQCLRGAKKLRGGGFFAQGHVDFLAPSSLMPRGWGWPSAAQPVGARELPEMSTHGSSRQPSPKTTTRCNVVEYASASRYSACHETKPQNKAQL